jgi:peroxiredoxin family protein
MMKKLIHQKNGQTASDLFQMAMEREVKFIACEASLKLLGITPEELIEYQHLEIAGVDRFIKNAQESQISLFI